MSRVSAVVTLPGRVSEAERCWYDLSRWPDWVDGLAEIVEVSGEWPKAGSAVVWRSTPAGRGTVTEQVVEYEPRIGQTSQVEDDSMTARQTVSFTARPEDFELRLSMDYRLKRRSLTNRVVDLLFIRRLMGASLARTLAHFETVLGDSPPGAFK